MSKKKLSYKAAVAEIEEIVQRIEEDEPDVDELAGMVQRALTLLKECKSKLKNTQGQLDQALAQFEQEEEAADDATEA